MGQEYVYEKIDVFSCVLFVMGGLHSLPEVDAYKLLKFQRYESAAH